MGNLEIKCLKCGNTFQKDWYSMRKGFNHCPYAKDVEYFTVECLFPHLLNEFYTEKNSSISLASMHPNSSKKIWWKCKSCGYIWQADLSNRTYGQQGCGNCMASKGETSISSILDDMGISYEREKRFPDCRDVGVLRFDFYLPQYNLLVEYQGQQHYTAFSFGSDGKSESSEHNLEKIKFRDSIKRKYAKDNAYNYLEIPYWKFSRIDKVLENKINEIHEQYSDRKGNS